MAKMGRPPAKNPRNQNIFLRLTVDERKEIMEYVSKRGCTVTKLMLDGFEALKEKEAYTQALAIVREQHPEYFVKTSEDPADAE